MSYIQLDIGGKKRGLKFNQLAMIIFSEKTDKDNELATAGYALFYAGLKANCYVKGEEADFTFEESCEWFEQLTAEQINEITTAFNSTLKFKEDLPPEKETKKKLVKKSITTKV